MRPDCVILAAGASARMGRNKLLLELGGKTVLERCIDAFYDVCGTIILVTGPCHEEITARLLPDPKLHIVRNEHHREGMFRSVREGVRHVEAERFFLTPGDYPLLQRDTVRRMAEADGSFVVPVYGGVRGHPIRLDRHYIPAILRAESESLRACLAAVPAAELWVDDSGVVTDMDTPEDYKRVGGMMPPI